MQTAQEGMMRTEHWKWTTKSQVGDNSDADSTRLACEGLSAGEKLKTEVDTSRACTGFHSVFPLLVYTQG